MFVCLESVIRKLQKGLGRFSCLSSVRYHQYRLLCLFSISMSVPYRILNVHVCVCERERGRVRSCQQAYNNFPLTFTVSFSEFRTLLHLVELSSVCLCLFLSFLRLEFCVVTVNNVFISCKMLCNVTMDRRTVSQFLVGYVTEVAWDVSSVKTSSLSQYYLKIYTMRHTRTYLTAARGTKSFTSILWKLPSCYSSRLVTVFPSNGEDSLKIQGEVFNRWKLTSSVVR
jgi:hypothetical protein